MPALVAGIHVLRRHDHKDVDGRDKPGHDDLSGKCRGVVEDGNDPTFQHQTNSAAHHQ
jgi:hypothetical protein